LDLAPEECIRGPAPHRPVLPGTQFCPKVMDALESIYRQQPGLLGAVALRAVGEAAA
jgi:hypothetical protein